jgi:2-polyprenyl-3-methyl-5-hydroxy-6-metoxy-1,4-benzoquinol methylase
MSERAYQYDFSIDNAAMHSVTGRRRKAETMLAVLREILGERLASARVLNLGCSTGIIDEYLAPHVASTLGIDIDAPAIAAARERCKVANAEFRFGDAMNLDLGDASADVVICSQVYEHVPDPSRMMDEIHRVLAPEGICYFAATNRFCVVEQHYGLPFLSVIPVPLAHLYLRIARMGHYYHERHYGLKRLRRLVERFSVDDYTLRVLNSPEKYASAYLVKSRAARFVAKTLARFAYGVFPGYVWVLRPR